MARSPSPWRVKIDRSKCEFAFFVSHVSEDIDEVGRFANALQDAFALAGGLPIQACFLDVDDWEIGNPPKAVIRKKLAASQFFLGWVTPHYLNAANRGWVYLELAYAELIELSRQPVLDVEFPFVVPVFRNVLPDDIQRTPWLDYLPREVERSQIAESIDEYLERLVPKLISFYEQETRKWAKGK